MYTSRFEHLQGEELCAFEKMSVSDSDHESMNRSSSKEGVGSGGTYYVDTNHSSKK